MLKLMFKFLIQVLILVAVIGSYLKLVTFGNEMNISFSIIHQEIEIISM